MLWTPTRRARALTAGFTSRRVLSSPCHAAPSARRPPPRRRRGKPKSEPRPSFSCAQEHYKYPSKLILSLFRFFPTPTHRNTFAAPSISAATPACTRSHPSATAQPKSNPPAPSSCFTLLGPISSVVAHRSADSAVLLRRRPACSRRATAIAHPDLDSGNL